MGRGKRKKKSIMLDHCLHCNLVFLPQRSTQWYSLWELNSSDQNIYHLNPYHVSQPLVASGAHAKKQKKLLLTVEIFCYSCLSFT